MKIINKIFLTVLSVIFGIYLIVSNSAPSSTAKTIPLSLIKSTVNVREGLIPDLDLAATTKYLEKHLVADTTSIQSENPHLPVSNIEQYNDYELGGNSNDVMTYKPLETGQSRMFLNPSQYGASATQDIQDNVNDGYFLQPGQSRRFFPVSDN
ncbi:hypothetical protein MNBD_GAMMA05-939 [hydrothermal vent metagenome]|uniref:Uncharacterized protein n=1 Tax=hydrothermal vent metagenome TaxID=652676 RepID=A0A3B0W6X4_9ZZZZ